MKKAFAIAIVLFAIIIAVLGLSVPRQHLGHIIAITSFFNIMIPILAVGALITYIMKSCCCCSCGCCSDKEEDKCCSVK